MNTRYIPFSPPDIGEAEIAEVADTLRSGWITTGPKTKLLEKKVAEWIGVGYSSSGTPRCVCLNSQTACAEMSLRLLGIGKDSGGDEEDEVIVPAYTYSATASVVCHVGAKLVIVDTQKDSLEMDYDQLESKINEHTKAIIPVDLAGIPCDYERIFEIVERKRKQFVPDNNLQKIYGRVIVLSDAAHAFGATFCNKMIGNIADITCFSWHAVKNFTTAEGGCLTWKPIEGLNDDDIYQKIQLLSLHGQSKDALKKNHPGMWEYDILGTWYKCNMTDVMASIGLAQFKRYPEMLLKRKEIISKYDSELKPMGIEGLCHYNERYSSSGHLYITRIPGVSDEQRREIIIKMAEVGVCCNVHYKPLPMHTAYKKMGFDIANYPNAFALYVNEITLPLHTKLSAEDVSYVTQMYRQIVGKYI